MDLQERELSQQQTQSTDQLSFRAEFEEKEDDTSSRFLLQQMLQEDRSAEDISADELLHEKLAAEARLSASQQELKSEDRELGAALLKAQQQEAGDKSVTAESLLQQLQSA